MADTTAFDDERTRINTRLAEIDRMVEQINCMLAVHRAVITSRNCKLQDKVNQLGHALRLLNGGER